MIGKIIAAVMILSLIIGGCESRVATHEDPYESVKSLADNVFSHYGKSSDLNVLIGDLYKNKINTNPYIVEVYDCSDYAIDLTTALNDTYESGIVAIMSNSGDDPNHMMSWVNIDDVKYVIEPQSDIFYESNLLNESDYADRFELIYGPLELGWEKYNTTDPLDIITARVVT